MKIVNTFTTTNSTPNMKISSKQVSENDFRVAGQGVNSPQFGGVADFPTKTMDLIARGGLWLSFCIQDFLGMICPRIGVGFYRNKDVTGKYNYGEAAEVAIREILTGPPMFMIPMALMWGTKKLVGTANDVPTDFIKCLGKNFEELVAKKNITGETAKKEFYKQIFSDILTSASQNSEKGADFDARVSSFTDTVFEIEKAKKKSLIQKIKNVRVEGSADDLQSDLLEKFIEIRKKHLTNASDNFSSVSIKNGTGKLSCNFNKFLDYLKNFTDDISGYCSKNNFTGDDVKNFIQKRVKSRNILTVGMLSAVILFCFKIPDLYQLHAENPGTAGLDDNKDVFKSTVHSEKSKIQPTVTKNLSFQNSDPSNYWLKKGAC